MKKLIPSTLCAMLFLALICTKTVVAQSAAPTKKGPTPAKLMVLRNVNLQTRLVKDFQRELDRINELRASVKQKLDETATVEDTIGVSVESFPEIVKNLQSKRIDLVIDLAGLDAKRDAILAAEKGDNTNQDAIKHLEKLVELKQVRLEDLRKQSLLPQAQLAQLDLLQSQVQLANAKSPKTSSSLLSNSLLDTSLELAEKKARLEKTETLLADVLPSRDQLESLQQLKSQIRRLEEAEFETSKRLRAANAKLEQFKLELADFQESDHRP